MFGNRTATITPPPLPASHGNGNGNGNGHSSNDAATHAAPAAAPVSTAFEAVKRQVHGKLLETLDLAQARRMPREQLQVECSRRVDLLLGEQKCPLSAPEKQKLLREVMDEIFGLGPVEELLRDPMVTDILVNGPHLIYIERGGRLEETTLRFRDDEHLIQVIQRIAARVGRRIDESSPMLDARLADGSRVNAIIPPLSLDGASMSIRRFGAKPFDVSRLVQVGAIHE